MKKQFKKSVYLAAVLTGTWLMNPYMSYAQLVPHDTATTVFNAPNGVPVVNIAKTNGAGVSHNEFNNYNVDSRGVVLNNGDASQLNRLSQLAGQVPANTNLTTQANVIINEVVMPNRSLLAGFTEVLGGTADVVVANPYGVTCNGCGFINTQNVSLTTGTPQFNGSGALTGFQVNEGDILITGAGLNGTTPDYLGLIARSLQIQGQVNAKTLDVVSGANDWDYATHTATPRAGTGAVPTYAIDSSALGGMYANRIRLIATEAGVGVRLLGEAASGVDDFTITSSGQLTLGNKLSSARDLSITSTAGGANVFTETDLTFSAARDLSISAGDVVLHGGALTAGRNLGISSATLTDAMTGTVLTDNNKRYAANNMTLTQTGATSIDGTSYGAGAALTGSSDTLTFDSTDGATLYGGSLAYTTAGAIALNKGNIKTTGNLALTSTGALSVAAVQNIQSTGGNVTLNSGNFSNNGTITADGGDLTVVANGTLNNTSTGVVHASNNISLSASSTLTNDHNVVAGNDLTIASTGAGVMTLNNNATGTLQATGGTFYINSHSGTKNVDVNDAGTALGHDTNWNARNISISNNISLQTTNDLTINATSFTFGGSAASLFAGHDGSLTLSSALSDNALIYGTHAMTVSAPSITVTGTGALASGGTLTATATTGNFTNNGALYAGSNMVVNAASGTLTNSSTATINSNGAASFTADTFVNNNDINILGSATVSANTFHNDIAGVTIGWDYLNSANGFDGSEGGCSTYGGGASYPNGCNDGRTAAQAHYADGWVAGILVSGWHRINTSGTDINGPYSSSCDYSGAYCNDTTDRYLARFYTDQLYKLNGSYIVGKPSADLIPTLIAGTLTIKDFTTATNSGGVISAGTVNINTTKPGATFTNDDLHLERYNWRVWWDEFQDCDAVNSCGSWQYRSYDKWIYSKETLASDSIGAGIFATTLNASGFSLNNVSSVYSPTITSKNAPTTVSGATFGGITVTLPTNPNGFFVVSQNPNSTYLIETNPKFADPNLISSDYMAKQYGIDLTSLEQRLGDAAYEASLVRQQLISQVGTNLVVQGGNEAQQMQTLMDNGVSVGKQLGLTYGKALTQDQIAGLKSDMVWMVDTVVNGQHVLAPVVYLSDATKSMFQAGGATIAAANVNANLNSLTNTGGTIKGTNTLNVTSKGDITNTSGTITGGDVSLKSTEGSISNKTVAVHTGDDTAGSTDIGKTGTIGATGNLALDAKKDITNVGADMSAGKDASLKAGNNITFDTIEDKEAHTDYSSSHSGLNASTSSTTTSTTKNIGSNLKVGGNLNTDSGNDTTIRGSNVDVKGNGDMHAGGNLNILDVQDENHVTSTTTSTGVGVGGGVYGTQKDTDDLDQKTSVGSKLNFGGNAKLSADKDLTVQGSDVGAGGDLGLKGDSVNILEGRNEETHKHTTETTTFLSVGSSGNSDSGTDTSYNVSDEDKEAGKTDPDAGAGAHANAEAAGGADLSLAKTTKTETNEFTSKAKGSNIKSGGNMTVESNKDTTIRGSNVEAGGDVDVNAGGNLNIEAAEDKHTKNTKTTETSIGFHTSSENKADAGAQAGASADDGGATANAKGSTHGAGANVNAGDANADADASAGAEASSDNSVDLVRHTETETNTADVTHTKSSIKSGGNTKLKATNDINVKGSDVDAGGDLDVDAGKDLNVTAVQDTHETTEHSSKTAVGLYAEAGADAKAEAHAKAGAKTGAEAGASTEANANAGVGLKGTNTTEDSVEGSTKAQTSSLKSGGNMSRKAGNKITDEGTQIEAGGDYTQDSKEWESKAAKDTSYSSKNSETNTAKLGLYAEGSAEAHASGEASIGKPETDTGAEAGASAGVKASYERETKNESASSSKAVTGSIKSGGKLKTTTTGKTSLEGTNLESGGDMELNAGSLDYKAAHDTETSSKGGDKANGEIKVGVDATKAVTGSLSGGYEKGSESESSSTAVVGGMKSGGKLKVNTKGDANFEGTNIESADDASVKSDEGSVNFNAAHDTKTSTSDKMDVSASISASKSKGSSGKGSTKMGAEVKGGMEHKTESEDNAVTGSIKSGGKLDVSAKKNVTLEGTAVESKGDTTLDAGQDVNFKAAKSTKSSEEYGFKAELGVTKGGKDDKGKTKGAEGGLKAEGNYGKSDESTSTTGSIKSGGGIKVKSGNNTTLEGTNLESEGKTSIDAGGDVNFKAAEDTKTSIKVEAELDAKKEEGGKGGNIGATVEGGKSNTKKAGSIKAGEIDIKSGKDTTLEGTNLDSKHDTSIDAGGNLNLNAAESTHIDGSFSGKAGSDGAKLKDAGIGGGVTREGSTVNTGGDLKLKSGGKTTMTGTKAKVEGKATIDAQGGEEENSAVSGGGQIGTSRAGADIDVQKTSIDAKGGVTKP